MMAVIAYKIVYGLLNLVLVGASPFNEDFVLEIWLTPVIKVVILYEKGALMKILIMLAEFVYRSRNFTNKIDGLLVQLMQLSTRWAWSEKEKRTRL